MNFKNIVFDTEGNLHFWLANERKESLIEIKDVLSKAIATYNSDKLYIEGKDLLTKNLEDAYLLASGFNSIDVYIVTNKADLNETEDMKRAALLKLLKNTVKEISLQDSYFVV